jgi:hypothetical protein
MSTLSCAVRCALTGLSETLVSGSPVLEFHYWGHIPIIPFIRTWT